VQRAPRAPRRERVVGVAGPRERALRVDLHHCVDRAVDLGDAVQVRLDELARRDRAAGDEGGERGGRRARELVRRHGAKPIRRGDRGR
jgi:hypothetical protein